MPKKIPEGDFKTAQKTAEEINRRIEEDKKRKSSRPLVQEFPPDLVGNLESEVTRLQEEHEDFKKTIRAKLKPLSERFEKVEGELKSLKEENETLLRENEELKERIRQLNRPLAEVLEELGEEVEKELKKEADKKS